MCIWGTHLFSTGGNSHSSEKEWNLDNKKKKETVDVRQGKGHLQQHTSCHGWHLIKGERVCSALSADIDQKVTVHKGYILYESWLYSLGSALIQMSLEIRARFCGYVNTADHLAWLNSPKDNSSTLIFMCWLEISNGMSQKISDTWGILAHPPYR